MLDRHDAGVPYDCQFDPKKLESAVCRPQSQRDGVSQLVDYVCSLYAIPFSSEDDVNLDARPHLVGNFC